MVIGAISSARAALRVVGLAAATMVAALPVSSERSSATTDGADVAMVLDVSMSMLAADVVPTRLSEARRQLLDLLDAAQPSRVAVLAFAGDVRVLCPLTADGGAVRQALGAATEDAAAAGGSDIGAALAHAGELLGSSAAGAHLVLVSDGEPGPGDERDPIALARDLRRRGVTLTVIGAGASAGASPGAHPGAPIPVRHGSAGAVVLGRDRQPRLSKPDPRRLAALAEAAGGRFAPLVPGGRIPASMLASAGRARTQAWTGAMSRARLLTLGAIGALLLDTALWWLRRESNPWG
jgi:Ca-activated chloride channel family protein